MKKEEKKEKVDYRKIIEEAKAEMEKAISLFKENLAKIRSSRASPALVENLEVECFGQKFHLRQLAMVSIPEPRQILIQAWDESYIEGILRAIQEAKLNLSVNVDKNLIRISLPPLTEEFRKDLLKIVAKEKEEVKKKIRLIRQEVLQEIQKLFQEKKISEDHKYKGKEELQELIEEFNEKIEEMIKNKEKEILE